MSAVSNPKALKRKLVAITDKVAGVASNVIYDTTTAMWEIKTLGLEIAEYPQVDSNLYTKLVKAEHEIGLQLRGIEAQVEEIRHRLGRMIRFFDRNFEQSGKAREMPQEEEAP